MAFQKGDLVDRYQLEARLGQGSFGDVWRASQLVEGEDVGVSCAIKIMRLASGGRSPSSASAATAGWLDEVRALVKVQAGGTLPRILEANVWHEHAFIAMELLEGGTLAERIARGNVPWRRALFIAEQIAIALEEAHKLNVVHRDLKPQNVILAGPGRVCVIDWGIARLNESLIRSSSLGLVAQPLVDTDGTDDAPVDVQAAPQKVSPGGTPGYIAPESYEGVAPTPAQDAFALGVVLYEMLTRRLPHAVEPWSRGDGSTDSKRAYRGSLDRATMDHDFVPLAERYPGLPSEVVRLVDALLAPTPEKRPTALRKAIQHAKDFPHGIPDPPYTGLMKLGPEHASLFFGQDAAIGRVLARLETDRGVLLWGPSGSGKSSLALAGVAARMDQTLFRDTDGWTLHVVRPLEATALRLAPESAAAPRGALGHVVVIDQLEEVVDLATERCDEFCKAVTALLEGSAAVAVRDVVIGIADEVRVVATIRDDLEWRVDRGVPALRALLEKRLIVQGIDANSASKIISAPATAAGYTVEGAAAVAREVAELLSVDPAKLPVVQFALTEWWERRDKARKVLPAAEWTKLGGVDGTLSFVAERFFSGLDEGGQRLVQSLFVRLFDEGRKQPLLQSSLAEQEGPMLDELVRLRLVGRRVRIGTTPYYEVDHESLAQNWSRLTGWIAEAREDRLLANELEREAAGWLIKSKEAERLWKKGRLASADAMVRRGRVRLNDDAKKFLAEARRAARWGIALRAALVVAAAGLVAGVVYADGVSSAKAAVQLALLDDAKAKTREVTDEKEQAKKDAADLQAALHEAQEQRKSAQAANLAADQARAEATTAKDNAVKEKAAADAARARAIAICGHAF
jgi:serine/threonine protein kinase